jgi:hypothetical protein
MSLCISYHITAGENLLQLVRVYGSRAMSVKQIWAWGGAVLLTMAGHMWTTSSDTRTKLRALQTPLLETTDAFG